MIDTQLDSPQPGTQRFAAAMLAIPLAIVWTHGLAALLRHLGPSEAPLAAWGLTLGAGVAAAVGASLMPRLGILAAAAVATWAFGAIAVLAPGSWAGALALPLATTAAVVASWKVMGALVSPLGSGSRSGSGSGPGRRLLVWAWSALALLGAVQTGRLMTSTTDPTIPFVLTTDNPFWAGHQCLPAYLYAAELVERGEPNVYASHHYPALDPSATPRSELAMTIEDPFQYPPPFLLLPQLALRLSNDFATLRTVWCALQITLYLAAFVALAWWIGGTAGRTALWALPVTLGAFPMLHNFQFGQFHLPAVALALLAMLGFSRGRQVSGGLLLAIAILSKVFPIALIPYLAGRRRWKSLVSTFAWGAALSLVALGALGPGPFVAFFTDHLPRLGSGEAFAFDDAWPELASLVVVDNQGVFGLARKLGAGRDLAAMVGRAYFAVVLLAALWLGRRSEGGSRWARAAGWLGVLGLASLASAGAWGDYVPATAVWLLALLAPVPLENPRWRPAFIALALLEGLLLGTMPIGDWAEPWLMVPLATLGSVAMLLCFWYSAVRPPEASLVDPASVRLASSSTGPWRRVEDASLDDLAAPQGPA